MNYTLHQLAVFAKVCELRSITKAAEALHLSQPAVSIQLKNFQQQFDVHLTEVIGRKLFVTEFGEEVANAARKILQEVEAINYQSKAFKGALTGRLRIAAVSTGKYVIPYFLSGYLRQHPFVELSLDVTNKSLVINSLEENTIDFALVSILPEHLDLQSTPLLPNQLILVANPELYANAGQEESNPFQTLPVLYREMGSGTRLTMERFLHAQHIVPSRRMELTSNEAVKQAVLAGLGISIMPVIGIRTELNSGSLAEIPYPGLPIATTWHLIHLKSKKLSPAALGFLEYLNVQKENIIHLHFSGM